MKKIFLLIISVFVFVQPVYAARYYQNVAIKASFSEEVNLSDIKTIEVVFEDASEYSKSYILKKENNFELNLENIPVGPFILRYSIVNDDVIGYYSAQAEVTENELQNSLDVMVTIALQNNKKNTTDDNKISNLIDQINKKTPSNSLNNGATNTTTSSNNSSGIIIDDEDISDDDNETDHDPNYKPTNPITNSGSDEKRQEERAKNRQKSNLIGTIMFSIIGVFLLFGVIITSIKFIKANK